MGSAHRLLSRARPSNAWWDRIVVGVVDVVVVVGFAVGAVAVGVVLVGGAAVVVGVVLLAGVLLLL